MNWGELELQYRKTALASATPVGVIMMLYDQLVKDLRKSVAAMEAERPEDCANGIKHALLVIQQLEGSMDQDGSELVNSLVRFYSMLRSRILQAQANRSVKDLNEQIATVLDVREAWQQIEARNLASMPSGTLPAATHNRTAMNFSSSEDFRPTNWSA